MDKIIRAKTRFGFLNISDGSKSFYLIEDLKNNNIWKSKVTHRRSLFNYLYFESWIGYIQRSITDIK